MPDLGVIDVVDADHHESPLLEPAISSQRLTEVAGADDRHANAFDQAQLSPQGGQQVNGFVTHSPYPLMAQVGEVTSHLGSTHTHGRSDVR